MTDSKRVHPVDSVMVLRLQSSIQAAPPLLLCWHRALIRDVCSLDFISNGLLTGGMISVLRRGTRAVAVCGSNQVVVCCDIALSWMSPQGSLYALSGIVHRFCGFSAEYRPQPPNQTRSHRVYKIQTPHLKTWQQASLALPLQLEPCLSVLYFVSHGTTARCDSDTWGALSKPPGTRWKPQKIL